LLSLAAGASQITVSLLRNDPLSTRSCFPSSRASPLRVSWYWWSRCLVPSFLLVFPLGSDYLLARVGHCLRARSLDCFWIHVRIDWILATRIADWGVAASFGGPRFRPHRWSVIGTVFGKSNHTWPCTPRQGLVLYLTFPRNPSSVR
jgi:hypothetical protein